MPRSEAHIPTPHSQNYLAQLCDHFSFAVPVHRDDDQAVVDFGFGTCRLTAGENGLSLIADAFDAISIARVEYLVGEHLERFGARESLTVEWQPVTDTTPATDPPPSVIAADPPPSS
ncbi:DUF2218 domain-containing protein [Solwaraspora sp. WMMB335]|uniref:DUF2218 domain-containing protein n=1 Tax=Solwaraspora sp. WMMB335 TaxID=3404118 RepID=UPI003B93880F